VNNCLLTHCAASFSGFTYSGIEEPIGAAVRIFAISAIVDNSVRKV